MKANAEFVTFSADINKAIGDAVSSQTKADKIWRQAADLMLAANYTADQFKDGGSKPHREGLKRLVLSKLPQRSQDLYDADKDERAAMAAPLIKKGMDLSTAVAVVQTEKTNVIQKVGSLVGHIIRTMETTQDKKDGKTRETKPLHERLSIMGKSMGDAIKAASGEVLGAYAGMDWVKFNADLTALCARIPKDMTK